MNSSSYILCVLLNADISSPLNGIFKKKEKQYKTDGNKLQLNE